VDQRAVGQLGSFDPVTGVGAVVRGWRLAELHGSAIQEPGCLHPVREHWQVSISKSALQHSFQQRRPFEAPPITASATRRQAPVPFSHKIKIARDRARAPPLTRLRRDATTRGSRRGAPSPLALEIEKQPIGNVKLIIAPLYASVLR
jgi:hypothetical protein